MVFGGFFLIFRQRVWEIIALFKFVYCKEMFLKWRWGPLAFSMKILCKHQLQVRWVTCLLSQLFVCFCVVLRPTRDILVKGKRHYHRWRAANFNFYSAHIEQWEFFSVPLLLLHGSSVNNGHLRGPATHGPVAERLAVKLSEPVLMT